MNRRIKLTIGVGFTVLFLAAVFATAAFAQGPGGAFGRMMDGLGQQGPGFGGMMDGRGHSGFGGMMGFGNAMNGTMPANCPMSDAETNPIGAQAIGFDKAVEAAQQYLNSFNNADLALAEVMEFDNNFYAVVTEKSTGTGAFELLVNRYTGAVYPEPGPNMMWNTKYGHMAGGGMMGGGMMGGGMMGGRWNQPAGAMTVTVPRRHGGAAVAGRQSAGRRAGGR
jgi:hypothetical protein